MNGRVGVTVVILAILLGGTSPVAAVAGGAATAPAQSEPFAVQQDQIDADEVRMDVRLQPNGTAEWTLEFWIRLDDNESTAAFESLQEDIRNDPANYTQSLADRMNETVATASNATGREMAADRFSVGTERQSFAREYGVVRYTFRWHGFAAVEGDELRAGDAVEGIYLDDGTRLLIQWPEGYERTSVTPAPDDERDRAVIWRGGETDFVSGEPRVVVTAAGSGPATTMLAAAAAVAAGVGVAGVWWYRNRTPTAGRAPDEERDATSSPETDAAASTAASTATDESGIASAAGQPDPELLSNEEQVLRLVRNNGGRMKQQAVVDELGWTDAKTSKVVSGLRDEGELESFRLGRENVLTLPDQDGDGADGEGDGDGGSE